MPKEPSSKDYLNLGSHPQIAKIISAGEEIAFSDKITKINKRGTAQERFILITNKKIYNLKKLTAKSVNVQRQIDINRVVAFVATAGGEFVVKISDEYDYHYKAKSHVKYVEISSVVSSMCKALGGKVEKKSLEKIQEDVIVRKAHRGQMNREAILLKTKQLASEARASDDEDRAVAKGAHATQEITLEPDRKKPKQEAVGIADFDLLKVLGRGAFGKVMQVRKKDNGKVYAIKILQKAAIIGRNQVEHTKAERHILETMQHPFLMTLRFAFQSKEKLYLVLDYFQGGELFFHLKDQRRFAEDVARIYVAEIAMAFGHLHKHDMIYRDLKPENILLSNEGHVCLTDFGLAKEVGKDAKTNTFCGTPEYLAPEIIASSGHDKAVDWWSLGILLYELTVGIPPFYSQNAIEMYKKIQTGTLRFPPFLTQPCKELIVGLLNRKPEDRLGSKDDFNDLKSHPFFLDLKNHSFFQQHPDADLWEAVYDKKLEPAFKPVVKDEEDVSNFDEEFLVEPVVDSVVAPAAFSKQQQDVFKDFSFKGGDSHLG